MNSINEAKRYLDNARAILREKANKEDGYYQDAKYVKMAGHTAYVGVLLALDGFLGGKKKGREDVDWYKQQLIKLDKDVLNAFVSVHQLLHLSMAYDGILDAEVAQIGLERADSVIGWVEQQSIVAA